jgi:hypothetical protein
MRPSWLGKCTTAAQFVLLLTIVARGSAPEWLLVLVSALSAIAALDYVHRFARLQAPQATPPTIE